MCPNLHTLFKLGMRYTFKSNPSLLQNLNSRFSFFELKVGALVQALDYIGLWTIALVCFKFWLAFKCFREQKVQIKCRINSFLSYIENWYHFKCILMIFCIKTSESFLFANHMRIKNLANHF